MLLASTVATDSAVTAVASSIDKINLRMSTSFE
jgi:hypothetical protein